MAVTQHFAECPANEDPEDPREPGDCVCREIAEDLQAEQDHDQRKEEG
jgi:hypothetical protein